MNDAEWLSEDVFTVDGLLSPEECRQYIARFEDDGFEDAPIMTAGGPVVFHDVRNNQRVMFDDLDLAAHLWERVAEYVPPTIQRRRSYRACGLNERFRAYRYDLGQKFEWHIDGCYERDNGEKSFWTVLFYLNGGYKGGETSFDDAYSDESFEPFQVVPTEGQALFFRHEVHHKGEPVVSGRKYVLRSDVMYRPVRTR